VRIGFDVRDFPAIGKSTGIVRFMVRRGLFELSIANLEHVFCEVLGETNLEAFRERNYTTLRSLTDPALITRVERDFDLYLNDVLLELRDNAEEDAAAITDLLGREELDEDNLREFLGRQTALLPTLEGVPEKFHAMVFELRRIVPTWENCISFMAGSGFAAEILVAYLDRKDVRAAILNQRLPNDPKTLLLRQFLVTANSLSDEGYREYVRALPNTFKNFPTSLDSSKLTTLIEERKITFSKETLESLDVNTDLPVLFVAENIEAYLTDPDTFGLDDVLRGAKAKYGFDACHVGRDAADRAGQAVWPARGVDLIMKELNAGEVATGAALLLHPVGHGWRLFDRRVLHEIVEQSTPIEALGGRHRKPAQSERQSLQRRI
jgi:hypothetical protein